MVNRIEYHKNYYLSRRINCPDCGKLISFRAKKCAVCTGKDKQGLFVGEKSPNWKGGFDRSKGFNANNCKKYSQRRRKIVLDYYGNKCQCCGITTYEFLVIDHINGGGNKHRKEVGYGTKFYNWMIRNNFPEGFQVLCYNCNNAKGFYGKCPHNVV